MKPKDEDKKNWGNALRNLKVNSEGYKDKLTAQELLLAYTSLTDDSTALCSLLWLKAATQLEVT